MSDKTGIEWTDASWNPVVGCSRVSSGCDHCYAMNQAHRIAHMLPDGPYPGTTRKGKKGVDWTGVVKCLPERLDIPIRWKNPRRIFVNSMSDLFHPTVPFEFIFEVYWVMLQASRHTFQILTKRPERRVEFFKWALENKPSIVCLPNVWEGTSVEHQEAADERIPHLLRCPAAVRWLSMEPLLGPVDLTPFNVRNYRAAYAKEHHIVTAGMELRGEWYERTTFIDWVVVGGESGKKARPMHPAWARSLRDQCTHAGVSFFFKQWGKFIHEDQIWTDPSRARSLGEAEYRFWGANKIDAAIQKRGGFEAYFNKGSLHQFEDTSFAVPIGKHIAGRHLDGRTWDEYPEVIHA